MSDDGVVRDARGRIIKGSPGLHRKQAQPSTQDTSSQDQPPDLDSSFDDDIIAAANTYGRPRSKVGRRAFCEDLRDTKPTEFAALLRPALARKQEETAAGLPGIGAVNILSCPSDHFIAGDQMRAMWNELHGTPPAPADPPKLVVDNPPREPPQAGPALAANEITFGGDDDEPPQSA